MVLHHNSFQLFYSGTKSAVMTEDGLAPLLDLVNKGLDVGLLKKEPNKGKGARLNPHAAAKVNINPTDHTEDYEDLFSASIYCLGSLSENDDVKEKLVELGAVGSVVRHVYNGNLEIKRAAGYFLATITERMEFHANLTMEGALEAIVYLAEMEDVECQEYASFGLAHLASNRDCQVKLVSIGAVRALVSMIASDAEPRHYAGLALLKLADNFENHLKIAEEGTYSVSLFNFCLLFALTLLWFQCCLHQRRNSSSAAFGSFEYL